MTKAIHSLILFFVVLSNALSANGRNVISNTIEQDNRFFDFTEVFTSPMPLKISIEDSMCHGCWTVYILTKSDIFERVLNIDINCVNCIIDPYKIEKSIWQNAKRHYDSNLNRDIFKFKIVFTEECGVTDSKIINWALLPSRPIISDEAFSYTFNWEDNDIYPNGDFSFIVKANDASGFLVNISESFLFEEPKFYPWCKRYEGSPITEVSYNADWGEYVQVEAYNLFGNVLGDAICTTDYITDPAILERISELKSANIDILKITSSNSFISWLHNEISFREVADNAYLYNCNGQLIDSWRDVEHLNISEYPNGIYIVVGIYNLKSYKLKILKK